MDYRVQVIDFASPKWVTAKIRMRHQKISPSVGSFNSRRRVYVRSRRNSRTEITVGTSMMCTFTTVQKHLIQTAVTECEHGTHPAGTDMNNFEIFVAVVESGSFSSAAKRLHRTPSAISKQISLLEQKLNVLLFDRNTRSLEITEAGTLYYRHCKAICDQINEAETSLKDYAGEPSGSLNITWPNAVSYSPLVDAVAAFTQRYPDINVKINVAINVLNVVDEQIDFAFRAGPPSDQSMVAVPLFDIEPIFCASPEFVERYGNPESMEALADMPMILHSDFNLVQKARNLFPALRSIDIKSQNASNDTATNINLVKQGMGTTFLFRHMVTRELEDGSLIQLLPNIGLPKAPVFMMFQKASYMPKKNRAFIDFVKSRFADTSRAQESA